MSGKAELPKMLTLDFTGSLEKILAFSIGEEKSRECVSRLIDRYGSVATFAQSSAARRSTWRWLLWE